MKVSIKFFAATAVIAGVRQIEISVDELHTSSQIFARIIALYPELARHKLNYSINQTYATGDELVGDGDELAIFTAVSGG